MKLNNRLPVLFFIFILSEKFSIAQVIINPNQSIVCSTQYEPVVQDISPCLSIEVFPNPLNLTWNSSGNFTVYVKNKCSLSFLCKLSIGQLQEIVGDSMDINETYSEDIYLEPLTGMNIKNKIYRQINISTPENCSTKWICKDNICWHKKDCWNNSALYIIKIECKDTSHRGLAIEELTVNINSSFEKDCEEKWLCSPWSECYSNGSRYRDCIDLNNCNTTKRKPVDIENCTPEKFLNHVCGNGICEINESCSSCQQDCKCPSGYECIDNICVLVPACGNEICERGENSINCLMDCKKEEYSLILSEISFVLSLIVLVVLVLFLKVS